MKALTLHQPWASLVALGVKTIETRSWATKHRGPLAIHAGARPIPRWTGEDRTLQPLVNAAAHAAGWATLPGPDPVPFPYRDAFPLRAVVATCTLVDVVPIDPGHYDNSADFVQVREMGGRPFVRVVDHCDPTGPGRRHTRYLDEAAYGDFTPGRWAWLLADVVPLDPPVPSPPGEWHRGLWTWEPVAA